MHATSYVWKLILSSRKLRGVPLKRLVKIKTCKGRVQYDRSLQPPLVRMMPTKRNRSWPRARVESMHHNPDSEIMTPWRLTGFPDGARSHMLQITQRLSRYIFEGCCLPKALQTYLLFQGNLFTQHDSRRPGMSKRGKGRTTPPAAIRCHP